MAVCAVGIARLRFLIAMTVALLIPPLGVRANVPADTARFQADRVVVVADVHGAYHRLVKLLTTTGMIDDQLHWRGGRTHLVSLGDLLDRGPDGRRIMDLLRRLQREAADAGGRVHVLLGNHELMNLMGDLRYVSPADMASYADPSAASPGENPAPELVRRTAFAPTGTYGAWLLTLPATVVINGTAFVHGGLSPLAAATTPEAMNTAIAGSLRELLASRQALAAAGVLTSAEEIDDAAARLQGELAKGDAASAIPETMRSSARRFVELADEPLFGADGPFWYRGTAWCHPIIEQPVLDGALAAWHVQRVVVGHTPTPDHRMRARLEGRAILADTGMLASHFHGRASALILERGRPLRVMYANDPATPRAPETDDGTLLAPLPEDRVMAALRTGSLSVAEHTAAAADGSYPVQLTSESGIAVTFTPARRRAVHREMAAWRLDRLLGLNVVAPVAERRINGRDGVVRAVWPDAISETRRRAMGVSVPNACATGSNYDVVYVLDGLIGNDGRTADTLLYDPRTWRLASIDHGNSFGRDRRLPAYLNQTPHHLPPLLARRLRGLDAATLREHLGDLLSAGEIEAVTRRRDALLENWAVEN